MPGATPADFIDRAFWCMTRGAGELWHRLHLPYRQLPWLLARLLDREIAHDQLQELAAWFLTLPDCCLDGWFGKPLQKLAAKPADLMPLPQGLLQPLLRSIYNSKNFNIEVENNFARMQSMKRVGRGRIDLSYNLASKHILSEAKLAHVRQLTRSNVQSDPGQSLAV